MARVKQWFSRLRGRRRATPPPDTDTRENERIIFEVGSETTDRNQVRDEVILKALIGAFAVLSALTIRDTFNKGMHYLIGDEWTLLTHMTFILLVLGLTIGLSVILNDRQNRVDAEAQVERDVRKAWKDATPPNARQARSGGGADATTAPLANNHGSGNVNDPDRLPV